MAYTTSNPAGTVAGGTDLALKVFSGEVLTAFATKNVFMPLINTRTIASGKSATFPVIGSYSSADVLDHTPGVDITVNSIAQGEQVIAINSRKYASVFVDDFEEAMSHYEVRGQYSTEIGNALAKKVDAAIITQLDACANATPETGQPAVNADIALGATLAVNELVEAIFDAAATMESKDIAGDKVCVITPDAYYNLVQSDKAVNRDWTNGNGGIDTGNVFKIAGIPIMMSNNIPAGSWGYIFTPQAVGVVKLMDIKSEANYIPEKLGTLMASSYAMGEGVLNAGCSIRLTQA
ncbi:major head protein [Podophage Lau218]|uniref:Phage capsid protein n=2 Tax=Lauvirus lau218 TaxID=1465639 RepID=A0A060BR00_9CAUD|nr:major head protein [Podophage Lau218]AIA83152.1 phage capsid protein [Podophage Lau218]AIA83250.1 phage capsid protein [Lauvirus lau218]